MYVNDISYHYNIQFYLNDILFSVITLDNNRDADFIIHSNLVIML